MKLKLSALEFHEQFQWHHTPLFVYSRFLSISSRYPEQATNLVRTQATYRQILFSPTTSPPYRVLQQEERICVVVVAIVDWRDSRHLFGPPLSRPRLHFCSLLALSVGGSQPETSVTDGSQPPQFVPIYMCPILRCRDPGPL